MRKRVTEVFPFLKPIRSKQKQFCFYMKMKLDKETYSSTIEAEELPYLCFKTNMLMLNRNSGSDMQYQYNKVHNVQLATNTMQHLVILPNETFSFWNLVQNADKEVAFKDGLVITNDQLTTTYGGGLCQLSNILFWLFLHSPLTLIEHHPHYNEKFPPVKSEIPLGADATVSEGWMDLRVKNHTDDIYQLVFQYEEDYIYASLLCSKESSCYYKIKSENVAYEEINHKTYRNNEIIRETYDKDTNEIIHKEKLYSVNCRLDYDFKKDEE